MLGVYSTSLIAIEVIFSQDVARYFFTDITGPVRFYAINTTLSVFLFWSVALVFAASFVSTYAESRYRKERAFYLSQILVFGYLGFDDRFLIHEWLGGKAGINDALIIFSFGMLEVTLLLLLGEFTGERMKQSRRYIYLAALFFSFMVFIDALVPRELVPRLSLEDLSKTWAGVFLFMFAWTIYYSKINNLKNEARSKVR